MSDESTRELDPSDWWDLWQPYRRRQNGSATFALLVAGLLVAPLSGPAYRYQVDGMVLRLRSIVEHSRPKELFDEVTSTARYLRFLEPAAELVYASTLYGEHTCSRVADLVGTEPLLRGLVAYSLRSGVDSVPVAFGVELVLAGASARSALVSAGILDDVLTTGSEPTGMLLSMLRTAAFQGVTDDLLKGAYFDLQLRGFLDTPVEELTYRFVLDGLDRREAFEHAKRLHQLAPAA